METSHLDQQFYPLVEQALQGIVIYQDERIVYANAAAEKIIGIPAGALIQCSHEEVLHLLNPDQQEYAERNISELLCGQKKLFRDTMQVLPPTGEPLWTDIYASRTHYMGHPALLISFFDVTERRQAEATARQLVEDMKLAGDFIVRVSQMQDIDRIGHLLVSQVHELNPSGYAIVSLYDPVSDILSILAADGGNKDGPWLQDIIGAPLSSFTGMIYPQEVKGEMMSLLVSGKLEQVSEGLYPLLGGVLPRELCDQIERELSIGSVWTVGFSLEGRTILGGLIIAMPEAEELRHHVAIESIGSYMAVLLDRLSSEEALFESEQRFRALFEHAVDAMYIYSLEEQKFLEVNEGACSLWGYSRDELLGMDLTDLIPEDTLSFLLDQLRQIGEKKQITFETAYRCKGAGLIPSDVQAQWIQYQNKSCIFAVNRDIRERKRIEKALREGRQKYRDLSIHLQNVREEQNALIAKEIHDDLGQSLTALKMHLSMLAQDVGFPGKIENARSLIAEMKDIVDQTVSRVRKLSGELWPSILDVVTIVEALKNQVKDYEAYSGLEVLFETRISQVDLNKEKSLAVYRIVQEAFTNIFRHAGAHRVNVRVYLKPGYFCVHIEDDGQGFVLAEKNKKLTFGILGMKERASMFGGSLDIISQERKGTALFLAIPL